MNDYFIRLSTDVELFNDIINGKKLEISSLILEKEDAIEFTKIIYDEVDTGIFKATVNTYSSQNCIMVNIGITVVTDVITNLAEEGTKDIIKKGIKRLITKFRLKGMEIMEKKENIVIESPLINLSNIFHYKKLIYNHLYLFLLIALTLLKLYPMYYNILEENLQR
jgi:hypothetical protein